MIEIALTSNSNSVVKIDQDIISFNDWCVKITDITAVSFMFSVGHGYLSHKSGHIVLHTESTNRKISASNYGFLGFGEGENNMKGVVNAIISTVGANLLVKICTLIFVEKVPVKIGSVTFTTSGLEKSSITGKKHIPWAYHPRMGYGSKIPIFDNGTIHGNIAVVYNEPGSGKLKEFAIITQDEPNGFLVPHILSYVMNSRINNKNMA